MINDCYKFINTPLPYDYNALEPYIDEKTMHLHHDKHLETYIENLNKALESCPSLQKMPLTQLICVSDSLPLNVRTAIKNNAGGVYNHRFYFEGMINSDNKKPIGLLRDMINNCYKSFDEFKAQFKSAALSVFGSGYAWLTLDRCGNLKIITTSNQETPLTKRLCPIICIDVWEHAYYLKHYNKRGDYIDDWFEVVDWSRANDILLDN